MTKFKHTPEPWNYFEAAAGVVIPEGLSEIQAEETTLICAMPDEGNNYRGFKKRRVNAKRIVACVNGCKGIVDPETTVPELVKMLESCLEYIEHDTANRGQSTTDAQWDSNTREFRARRCILSIGRTAVAKAKVDLGFARAVLAKAKGTENPS